MRLLLVLFMACSLSVVAQQGDMLYEITGKQVSVNTLIHKRLTVVVFVSPDCPLCQSYSLTLRQLYNTYSSQGVNMMGIIPGTDYSDKEIVNFKANYSIPFVLYKDPDYSVTKRFDATITPEVVVLDTHGKIRYQGRIDNWAYELGKKRKVITEHNLKDAIESLLKGEAVKEPRTKAIGCFIE